MSDDYLDRLYDEMRSVAVANPRTSTNEPTDLYRRRTPAGLGIVLYVSIRHVWRMSLYRQGHCPSPAEVRGVKEAFGVPGDAKESRTVLDEWHIIRLEWPELKQGKLFELGPKESVNYGY